MNSRYASKLRSIPSGAMVAAVLIALFSFTELPLSLAGGGCSGCGGGDAKTAIKHLAVDTFERLLELQQENSLQVQTPQCRAPNIALMRDSFLGAIHENDIRVVRSKSDSECPLKDDSGDCPEFMTIPAKKQILVDIDRLIRHLAHSSSSEKQKYHRLQERVLHESYWLTPGHTDWNSQCSRELADHLRQSSSIDPEVVALLESAVKSRPQAQNLNQTGAGNHPPIAAITQQCPNASVSSASPGAGAIEKLASECEEAARKLEQPPRYVLLTGKEADVIAQLFPNRYLPDAPGLLSSQGPSGLACLQEGSRSPYCLVVNGSSQAAMIQNPANISELNRLAPTFPARGNETADQIPAQPAYTYCAKATKPHFVCSIIWIKVDSTSRADPTPYQ